jgi:hypothetical protein
MVRRWWVWGSISSSYITPTPNRWPLGWQRTAAAVDGVDAEESTMFPPSLNLEKKRSCAKRLDPMFPAGDRQQNLLTPFRTQDNPLWRPLTEPSGVIDVELDEEAVVEAAAAEGAAESEGIDHTDGVELELGEGLESPGERTLAGPSPPQGITPAQTEMPTPILDTPQRTELLDTGLHRLFSSSAPEGAAEATVVALERVFQRMDDDDAQARGGVVYSPPPAPRGERTAGFSAVRREAQQRREVESEGDDAAEGAEQEVGSSGAAEYAEQEVESSEGEAAEYAEQEVESSEAAEYAEQEVESSGGDDAAEYPAQSPWTPPPAPRPGSAWNGVFRTGVDAHEAGGGAEVDGVAHDWDQSSSDGELVVVEEVSLDHPEEPLPPQSDAEPARSQATPLLMAGTYAVVCTRLSASTTDTASVSTSRSAAGSLVDDADPATPRLGAAAESPCSTPELGRGSPVASSLTVAESPLTARGEARPPGGAAHVASSAQSSSSSDGFLEMGFDVSHDSVRYMFPGRSPPATPEKGRQAADDEPSSPVTPITSLEAGGAITWEAMRSSPQTAVSLFPAQSPFSTPGDGEGGPSWARGMEALEAAAAVVSPASVVTLPTGTPTDKRHTREPSSDYFQFNFE